MSIRTFLTSWTWPQRITMRFVTEKRSPPTVYEATEVEQARRTTFLGVTAWLSVCLVVAGMSPELAAKLNSLWMMSGLIGLASSVGLFEVVKRDGRNQRDVLKHYMKESRTDPLTGLANRRQLDFRLADLMNESIRKKAPLYALLIDIDHFKQLNDTYGHQAGDEVLQEMGRTLMQCVRKDDFVARIGGEEFVVIAPGLNLSTARAMSERIRAEVQRKTFSICDQPPEVTVSIGLSTMKSDDSPKSLLHRADTALYRAKNAGRNCTA